MAQPLTFTSLYQFHGPDGSGPSALVLSGDGSFYGTTSTGGTNNNGTIFKITPTGVLNVLHTFTGADGSHPTGIVQGTDGNLYGTTTSGGNASQSGTIFKLVPFGSFTTLHFFTGSVVDGAAPMAPLVQGSDGLLYGTTIAGGAYAAGICFSMTPAGTVKMLHSFIGPDGNLPESALMEGSDGSFRGTTMLGGSYWVDQKSPGYGTIFSLAPTGSVTIVHSFNNFEGAKPVAPVIEGSSHNFYGTTMWDGVNTKGNVYACTSAGILTPLFAFRGLDGADPEAGLSVAGDGNYYGTTKLGGTFWISKDNPGYGTIFEITPTGSLTVLHSFNNDDGSKPIAPPVQGGDGSFYGTTLTGGSSNFGTVYKLAAPPPTQPLASISVIPAAYSVLVGSNFQFIATAKDRDGHVLALQPDFVWSVNGTGTISDSGLFFAGTRPGGPFTVTAASGSVSGTASVTVTYTPALTSIKMSPASASIIPGGTQQFTATAVDQFGYPMSPQPAMTWSLSGGGTIDGTGLVKAGASLGGPFNVAVTTASLSGNATLSIIATLPSLSGLSRNAALVGSPGFTLTLTGSHFAVGANVTWNGTNLPTTYASSTQLTAAIPASDLAATGTSTVQVVNPDGGLSKAFPFIVAQVHDFNDDGIADIILQNSRTNQIALWYLNGSIVTGGQYLSATPDTGWIVVGSADFNGDGHPDLVMQNTTTNLISLWYLNGTTVLGTASVTIPPGTGWRVAGTGDFNGDGKQDLCVQNITAGTVAFWYLNGPTVLATQQASLSPPVNWYVVGAADFAGDGKPGLALQNTATNQIALWYLNGATITSGAYLSITPPSGWKAVWADDFNNDGRMDLVLRNTATNQIAFWYLNGPKVTGGQYASATPSSDWRVITIR